MSNRESVKKTTEQIIGYISGWVSKKIIKTIKSEACTECLFNNKLSFNKLIVLQNMGGLCLPSEDFFKICIRSETINN